MPFQFIQPQFAWALAGLAIPVIIHLMFRLRSRRVELGTLRFLRIVLEENARRRVLKRWLLLAMRMAAIMLLAGLFARPYLLARDQAGKDRLVAILIDRSASMQLKEKGRRLIDLAVEQAREVIGKCSDKTQIEVAFFDQTARPLGGGDSSATDAAKTGPSAKELLALLVAPEKTFSATNYGAATKLETDNSPVKHFLLRSTRPTRRPGSRRPKSPATRSKRSSKNSRNWSKRTRNSGPRRGASHDSGRVGGEAALLDHPGEDAHRAQAVHCKVLIVSDHDSIQLGTCGQALLGFPLAD
jgi:hypothetical protein